VFDAVSEQWKRCVHCFGPPFSFPKCRWWRWRNVSYGKNWDRLVWFRSADFEPNIFNKQLVDHVEDLVKSHQNLTIVKPFYQGENKTVSNQSHQTSGVSRFFSQFVICLVPDRSVLILSSKNIFYLYQRRVGKKEVFIAVPKLMKDIVLSTSHGSFHPSIFGFFWDWVFQRVWFFSFCRFFNSWRFELVF